MDFFKDPLGVIAGWLSGLLLSLGLPAELVTVILMALGIVVLGGAGLILPLFTIWLERRLVARMQDRLGPNRVGPLGIFQTVADTLKMLVKEDITPAGADKILYNLAPLLALGSVLMMWAVLPFAVNIYGVDLNVGLLYLMAVGSIAMLGILLAGWSSNNKYALLSAFRTVAQLAAYEVPMILSLLVPALLARSLSLNAIVQAQHVWFVFSAPLAFLIFLIAADAELGRAPFDLTEAESEIVAGFNIEYSGMKFGMFFVGEFTHAFTIGALMAALFWGGWRGPGAEAFPLLGVVYFVAKAFVGYFVLILLRGTLPRLRIDQMLNFNWKFLTPLALALVVAIAVADKLLPAAWTDATLFWWEPWARAVVLLGVNLLLGGLTIAILNAVAPRIPWMQRTGVSTARR